MFNQSSPLSRRELLGRMGAGFGAVALASLLASEGATAAPAGVNPLAPKPSHYHPRAKAVIHLFMNGGPSQVDTFDPKPALQKYAGQDPPAELVNTMRRSKGKLMPSLYGFFRHGQSGIEVSEIYPHLASCIDDICVIRSMHTNLPNHEPSLLMMNSGETQPTRPSFGSWITYGLGSENQNLPGYVVLCPGSPVVGPQLWSNSFLPGIYQGTHINNSNLDPKSIIRDINNRYVVPADQRRQLDLLRRLNRAHLEQRTQDAQLEGRIEALEMAFRMQFEAQDAFDVGQETAATHQLYGEGQFARSCLVARRLVERGVRVVQLYYGAGQPWDDHGDMANHRNHAVASDQAMAALIKDLKARGLFEETLVVWGGEFGRTPTSEGSKGRDHNNLGFSMWLAGGGIRGGMVHGATDDIGFSAVEDKVHVHDLHATILHLLGIDHTRLTYRHSGRDFRLTDVHGNIVRQILA
ncbi:MAG: DUF1501 domain-containing protein [Pirellulales bacterium]